MHILRCLLIAALIALSFAQPEPECICPEPPTCELVCEDLFGCASNYNVFVFSDFYGSTDVQGRVAAGGNVGFSTHFSIGDQLFPNSELTAPEWSNLCLQQYGSYDDCDFCDKCGKSVLVAGGTINTSPNSRIYFGNWLGTDLTQLRPEDYSYPEYATLNYYKAEILNDTTCPNLGDNLAQGFSSVFNKLTTLSSHFCNLPPTDYINTAAKGSSEVIGTYIYCGKDITVIYLNQTDLDFVRNTLIPNLDLSSPLVLNVRGSNIDLTAMDLTGLQGIANHVIWNFCDTQTLNVGAIAVWGTIVAPYADIQGDGGVINGQVFAKSFNGSTQVNWVPFTGCIDLSDDRTTTYCNKLMNAVLRGSSAASSGANIMTISIAIIVALFAFILAL